MKSAILVRFAPRMPGVPDALTRVSATPRAITVAEGRELRSYSPAWSARTKADSPV
jgi:hypothetical protein